MLMASRQVLGASALDVDGVTPSFSC